MILFDKVYGKQEIRDRAALDIMKTREMQRLKDVNQYGAWRYVTPEMKTTRFEHSVGVYLLLRSMGAGREEQIAGLLHDIGHTAFSHAFDYAVGKSEVQDTNDIAQEEVLRNSGVWGRILRAGMDPSSLLRHDLFPLLEKPLPDLCADRIDYVFRDSICYGIASREEAAGLLSSMAAEKNRIFLNDEEFAFKLSEIFMRMDNEYWRSPTQGAIYHLMGESIRIAMKEKIINKADLFTTDTELMKKLTASGNKEILSRISLIRPGIRAEDNPEDYDFFVRGKCRYIDPLVSTGRGVRRLSEINKAVKERIAAFRHEHSKGHHIKIIEGKK